MNKKLTDNTQVVTNKIVLFRVNLFEPVSFNNAEPKYGTGIIIPKDDTETINNITRAMEFVIEQANFIDRENLKLPLKDGDVERPADLLFQNSYYVYATTKIMPEVYDHNMKRQFGRTDITEGKYAFAYLGFAPYNVKGNKGISCKLYGIQTLPCKSKLLELQPDASKVFKVEK